MNELPDRTNFYSALDTTLSPEQIANLYGALGWRVGKVSWTDYGVYGPWCELVIEAESSASVLMHGLVADISDRVEELVAPLRAAGISFTAECYGPDPDRELLRELRS